MSIDDANIGKSIDYICKYPCTCDVEVTRKGNSEPCDKIAIAVTIDWWPVCAHHSRGRRMLPLSELLEALL